MRGSGTTPSPAQGSQADEKRPDCPKIGKRADWRDRPAVYPRSPSRHGSTRGGARSLRSQQRGLLGEPGREPLFFIVVLVGQTLPAFLGQAARLTAREAASVAQP